MKFLKPTEYSPVFKQALSAFACSMIAISTGLNNGFSAILLPQLEVNPALNNNYNVEIGSWIASLGPIGMIVGGISVGFLLDEFGRKNGQIIITFLTCLLWLLTGFANDMVLIIIGRFATSVIAGTIRPTTVVYIGEISNPIYRRSFLLIPTFCVNIGVIVIHASGFYIPWNVCAFISSFIGLLCFLFALFLKESPLWMISRGQKKAGVEIFKWLRGDTHEAEQELREVFEKVKDRKTKASFKEKVNIICSKRFLRPLSLAACFFCVLQFSGINILQYYAHDILGMSFGDTVSTFSLVMITDLIRLMSTVFVLILDKLFPRKFTFICICYLTGILLLCLSLFFYIKPVGFVWLSVLLIVMYVVFGSCMVSLSWTLLGEIFPGDIRGIASGISSTLSYIILFIAVKITPTVMNNYGEAALYALNGIITLIGTVFMNCMIPRTDGRTLQDIENSYNTTNGAKIDKIKMNLKQNVNQCDV